MEIDLRKIKKHRSRSRSLDKYMEEENSIKEVNQNLQLFLAQDYPQKQYYQRPWHRKKGVRHWGQRKLFITEIYFLTQYADLSKNIVYAGAAPGNHIEYLSSLFPEHHFYLVDPNPFVVSSNEKITIYNEYFTNKLCLEFKEKLGNCLFMSDIRTADISLMSAKEHEITIQKDNLIQKEWVSMLEPKKAMLKFRCPYTSDYSEKDITFIDGQILIQPWAPHSSTETRLICDANFKEKIYNIQEYENQMFYHNDTVRIEKRFQHKVRGEGIEYDFDSVADLTILQKYKEKFGKEINLGKFSEEVTKKLNCSRTLATRNKPKDKRRQFETKDHRVFYEKINREN